MPTLQMRWLGLLVASANLTSACRPRAPEIGRDLPTNIKEASEIFDARVKAVYQQGTSEERLVVDLRNQGFVSSPKHGDWNLASFNDNKLFMASRWSVAWRAENGRIVSIGGRYDLLAP